MKVFISHKQQDAFSANQIANELKALNVDCYLDLLDPTMEKNGRELTEHIRNNLNQCTDIIVVMSDVTKHSQWVPFEIGMAAQKDMPTATFLMKDVSLPDFLEYWPRLKTPKDIRKYVEIKKKIQQQIILEKSVGRGFYEWRDDVSETQKFYNELKKNL